ncbi:MAG TPA: SUF system NifU family Fe-S cluster assembly protein [Gammaproteobacteria bacterium]|nr:SUF system NifU family Fe-S cluster assembly protein [Gammaproteobacteria bacterium]
MDLRELYQDLIVDHNKRPRNFGKLDDATYFAEGFNPLCGDQVTVYVHLDGEQISKVQFEGEGCAISTASASLMTEALVGKTISEADALFELFHQILVGELELDDEKTQQLGKLAVLTGVKAYPSRVKCATLAWHTCQGALHNSEKPVTTE